jgi:hypothetical protein
MSAKAVAPEKMEFFKSLNGEYFSQPTEGSYLITNIARVIARAVESIFKLTVNSLLIPPANFFIKHVIHRIHDYKYGKEVALNKKEAAKAPDALHSQPPEGPAVPVAAAKGGFGSSLNPFTAFGYFGTNPS